MSDALSVFLTVHFGITPELLFRSWVDPLLLPQWLAPPPYRMVAAEVDARQGGLYRHDIEGPDGAHVVDGEFLAFMPGRHFRKSWIYRGPNPAPRREPTCVVVDIVAVGDGASVLMLTHAGLRDAREETHYRTGWAECFRRLEQLHA